MNRTKKTLLSVFMLFLTTGASAFPFISPYAYCNNNPVNAIDPDGRKTYLYATTLPGADPGPLNPLKHATHTFLVVTDSDGNVQGYYAYGSEHMGVQGALGGRLMQQHYSQDISVFKGEDTEHVKNIIEVTPPEDMSSEEFDQKVMDVANSFGNDSGISYFMLPVSETTGNCNTCSSTILVKAGVPSEKINEIKGQIPGICTGFSDKPRPWTKKEQKAAVEREKIMKDLRSRSNVGPLHP